MNGELSGRQEGGGGSILGSVCSQKEKARVAEQWENNQSLPSKEMTALSQSESRQEF